jgi:transposase
MKRRTFDPETKMAAVLEGLRGESSIADIRRKYQISESLHYRWRDKFLEGGSQALSFRNGSVAEAGSLRRSDTTSWLRPRDLGLVNGTSSPEQGFNDVAHELRGWPRPWQIPGAPGARRSC